MMAPFPAASYSQTNYERDPFNAAPFQGRSVSKNNPFRSINEVKKIIQNFKKNIFLPSEQRSVPKCSISCLICTYQIFFCNILRNKKFFYLKKNTRWFFRFPENCNEHIFFDFYTKKIHFYAKGKKIRIGEKIIFLFCHGIKMCSQNCTHISQFFLIFFVLQNTNKNHLL